jgi:uncharacterized membrane protein (DUF4010 family)
MEATQTQLLYRFGAALVLGLFMGLQREYAYRRRKDEQGELLAGARTYSIIALLGAASALGAGELDSALPLGGAVLAVGGLLAVGHFWRARDEEVGLTTEMAALVAFFTGAVCYWGHLRLAAGLGVGTAVLLSLKGQTHRLAHRIDREDVYATLKFAVITVIVLPLLPQQGYGPAPFDVVTPYNVWLMVVLISGISFLGYVLIKIVGPTRGVGLTGILGGLASSTAVTLSVAERSRDAKGLDRAFALAVISAWSIMFIRVIVEVAIVHPPLLWTVAAPVSAVFAAAVSYCGYLYFVQPSEVYEGEQTFRNPFRLGPAITFGLLYAVILVVTSAADTYFGDAGIYASSVVAGLADVDAITLSMAQLRGRGEISARAATRAILIAGAANTVLKGGIVALTGSRSLRRTMVPGLLLIVAASFVAALLV